MPINLGSAKLQRTQHTFVHYYDIEPLYNEFNKLDAQFNEIQISNINHSVYFIEILNYIKMVNFTRSKIIQRFDSLNLHFTNKLNYNRKKRGLINGLGTIVKSITGNLDSSDEERFNRILNQLQQNRFNIQNQLQSQYSVNHQMIETFNDTIRNIQHNELILKSRILQLNVMVRENYRLEHILFAKDIFNQLIILYNSIQTILQDIENSVTFCKIKTMHPSIMSTSSLFLELQKIESHYKEQLPLKITQENLLQFESLINVNCMIESKTIIYFLSIPIDYEQNFDLFYLHPLPSKQGSEFVTIIPNIKYFLKYKDTIKPLTDICTKNKIFQCPNYLQTGNDVKCENNILLHEDSSYCQYTKLNIPNNHIEIIPEINQYLAVFNSPEQIKIKCATETLTKTFTGIYLIKENNCSTFFKNQEIFFQEKTYGKPSIINHLTPKLEKTRSSPFKIELKNLNLKDIPLSPPLPIFEDSTAYFSYITPSAWTIILYIILLVLGIYYFRNWFKSKLIPITVQPQGNNPVQLPAEASF